MTIRSLFFCMLLLTMSMAGSAILVAVMVGLVSVPDPAQVQIEWSRPYHPHHHDVADADRVQP